MINNSLEVSKATIKDLNINNNLDIENDLSVNNLIKTKDLQVQNNLQTKEIKSEIGEITKDLIINNDLQVNNNLIVDNLPKLNELQVDNNVIIDKNLTVENKAQSMTLRLLIILK